MSPIPAGTIQKPKLSKKILEDQGIFFDEKVRNGGDLEGWICPIRERLVYLRTQLPKDAKEKFTKELEAFRRSGQDNEKAVEEGWSLEPRATQAGSVYSEEWYRPDRAVKKIGLEIDTCRKAAKYARQCRERNEMEPKWQEFLQKDFFKAFHNSHNNSHYQK